jgi:ATP-dependent exoDNAse (exonuclease V) beta subunit
MSELYPIESPPLSPLSPSPTAYLSTLHPHPRDSRIVFDEPTHTYSIDGSSEGIISVTTLIHAHFPHFDADTVIQNMRNGRNGLPEKYKGMTDEQIKQQWSDSGKEASGQGTRLHKSIELFYNDDLNYIYEEQPKEFHHFLAFHETIKHRLTPYRTEWSIFRTELGLAGQLDMLYTINGEEGKYALYDWKRSKEIKMENRYEKGKGGLGHLDHCNYSHYSIQLNVYKRLLETLYGLSIVEMCLVILHPDNGSFITIPVYEMKKEIDYIFKERKAAFSKKAAPKPEEVKA